MNKAQESNRIDYLDFMRVFAFLSVLLPHLFNAEIRALANDVTLHLGIRQVFQLIHDVCYTGGAGVLVFFLTSGYIITHVLQTESVGGFLFRRVFRIYPLYIFAVVCELVLTQAVAGTPPPSLDVMLPKLLLIGDFFGTPYALGGVEWTLRIEVIFYLFMATLKWLGVFDRPRALSWVLGLVSASLLICSNFPRAGWTSGYMNIFGPFLFIGVLTYLVEKDHVTRRFFFCFVAFVCIFSMSRMAGLNSVLKETNFELYALLVFLSSWAMRRYIVGNVLTKTFSEMTYAIYLFHLWSWQYLGMLVEAVGFTALPEKMQRLILLFMICYVLTKTIEKYGIKTGRTLMQRFRESKARAVTV